MSTKTIFQHTISLLTVTLSVTSLLTSPLAVRAAGPTLTPVNYPEVSIYKTNATRGLNVRDENCKVIGTLPLGSLVQIFSNPQTRSCSINGKSYSMTSTSMTYFVATDFLTEIWTPEPNINDYLFTMRVDSSNGLNLRDENCKRITSLPEDAKVNIILDTPLNSIKCRVNGTQYAMNRVGYDGYNTAYVASAFLKAGSDTNNEFADSPYQGMERTATQPLAFNSAGLTEGSTFACGNPNSFSFYTQTDDETAPVYFVDMIDQQYMKEDYEQTKKSKVDSLLSNPINTATLDADFNIARDVANSSCAGFFSGYTQVLDGITVPNLDQSRVFVALSGQSAYLTPGVFVIGKKGGVYVVMAVSNLNTYQEKSAVFQSCDPNFEQVLATGFEESEDLRNCYVKKLMSPQNITTYRQEAQKMITQLNVR